MSIFAIGFAVSLLLLLYPFVFYPVILLLLPRYRNRPDTRAGPMRPMRFALLMAARNERAALPETLDALRVLKRQHPALEIRVWNDASTDGTDRILQAQGDVLEVLHGLSPIGKGAGLQRLLEQTQAEVAIFMDANVRPPTDLIARLERRFQDPTIGAVGARSVAVGDTGSRLGRIYWGLEDWLKRLETRTGNTMGCDGALWAIKRTIYPRFDPFESDDFRPSMEPVLCGMRVVLDPDLTVDEHAIADWDAPTRAGRIGCGAWHAHRAIWPRLLRAGGQDLFKYVSHKLIRWFAGLWFVLTLGFGLLLAMDLGVGPFAAVLTAVSALAGHAGLGPFGGVYRLARILIATTLGVMHALLGGRVVTWAPVRNA